MRNILLAFLFAGCLILTCSLSAQTFTTLRPTALIEGAVGSRPPAVSSPGFGDEVRSAFAVDSDTQVTASA
jgi:hypothetical protein